MYILFSIRETVCIFYHLRSTSYITTMYVFRPLRKIAKSDY